MRFLRRREEDGCTAIVFSTVEECLGHQVFVQFSCFTPGFLPIMVGVVCDGLIFVCIGIGGVFGACCSLRGLEGVEKLSCPNTPRLSALSPLMTGLGAVLPFGSVIEATVAARNHSLLQLSLQIGFLLAGEQHGGWAAATCKVVVALKAATRVRLY